MNRNAEAAVEDHVERTIAEAVFRIGQLQDLVRGLHGLKDSRGAAVEIPNPKSQIPSKRRNGEISKGTEGTKGTRGSRPSDTPTRRDAETARVQASGRAVPNGIGERVRGVIAELTGVFDARMVLAELPGAEIQPLCNALGYMAKKGEIEVVVPGRPGCPAKYRVTGAGNVERKKERGNGRSVERGSGNAESPARRNAALGAEERGKLQDELEGALQERDQHQAAGRDGLAIVAQKKVDKLVAALK